MAQRVHGKLEVAEPRVDFEISDARTIVARDGEAEFVISLDNLAAHCTSMPGDCDEAIDAHVSAFRESLRNASKQSTVTKAALRVTLKNTQWIQHVAEQFEENARQHPDAPDNAVVTRSFHEDMHVVLVADAPETVQMVTQADLKELELGPAAAFDAAVANLASVPAAADVEMGQNVWGFTTDDSYAAARLLLDDRWPDRAKKVRGDLLAVAPSRDFVYFTGTKEPGGMAELRRLATEGVAKHAYPLSTTVLRWTDAGWVEHE